MVYFNHREIQNIIPVEKVMLLKKRGCFKNG